MPAATGPIIIPKLLNVFIDPVTTPIPIFRPYSTTMAFAAGLAMAEKIPNKELKQTNDKNPFA